MKLTIDDLPICRPVLTGHTLDSVDGSEIEKGDAMQIVAPRSKFHKWVVIYDNFNTSVDAVYFCYRDVECIASNFIRPSSEALTWENFKFRKINSLEDIEK